MFSLSSRLNHCLKFLLILIILVGLWLLVRPIWAATTTVDSFSRVQHLSPHADCLAAITVTNTDDSGPNTLRQALFDVCSDGIVDFAPGLTDQTITLTSMELSITKTVTISNLNAPNLKVSGNNAHCVFNIQAGAVVTINNLSIISGSNSTGGGIFNQGTLTVSRSNFSDNAAEFGGGISNQGTLTINNNTFSDNSARSGGGIGNQGTTLVYSTTLNGNSATAESTPEGGGIANYGTLIVRHSTITDNSTNYTGGGIVNYGTLTIEDSIVSGNSSDYEGGGIYNSGGAATIISSTLSSNSSIYGGGIFNRGNYEVLRVAYSTLSDNSALYFGGGIHNTDRGQVEINNSTFSGNSTISPSGGGGGGIYVYDGTLIVNNSTFSGNSSTNGGGIHIFGGTLNFTNVIVANSNGGDCVSGGTISTNIHNLVEDGSCSNNAIGFHTGDPLLGPLHDNGGPTLTHALLSASPAINAGDTATCLAEDQRGVPRPQLGQCDIGAFEAIPTIKVVLPIILK